MAELSDQVLELALALPVESRMVVVSRLIDSIADAPSPDIEKEWIAEAERRLKAYHEGRMKAIPGKEVLESLSPSRRRNGL